jgi:transcriptional regulator with XRE-family HTH domain
LLAILLPQWNNTGMIIGDRLRRLRGQKKLSQADIEKRSGLLRAYLSRVENGHTIPTIETLEKWAKALDVPMYQLFYEGDRPPEPSTLRVWKPADETTWGNSGDDAIFLKKLHRLLRKIEEPNRKIIYQMAGKMARRR